MKKSLPIRPSLAMEVEKVKEKYEIKCFLSQDVSTVGTQALMVPPCAGMRRQQGMRLAGRSAVEPHRAAQDPAQVWEGDGERKVSGKKKKEAARGN